MEPQHARFVPILANDICQGEVTLAIKSVIYTWSKHLQMIWAGLSTQWQESFPK